MGRPFVILFVIAAALLVARCSTEEARLRYRLTLTVRTPEGLRSGSSVLELALARKNLIPLPGVSGADWGGGFRSRGEAPFVDLGGGRTLFATVRAPDGDYRRRMTSVALAGLDLYRLRGAEPHGDSDRRIMRALDRAKPLKALAE